MNPGLLLSLTLAAAPAPVPIDGGVFELPVLLGDRREAVIAPFALDPVPVTNARFRAFVAANPRWSRERAPAVFRDARYLEALAGPADHPVTYVSWYAASAYCAAQGGRLPTLDEWEYVAAAVTPAEGYAEMIFGYYADPVAYAQRPVASGAAGRWGVHDMHGLVLEWVEDFQLVGAGASCGDTARYLPEYDPAHYATFLRYHSRGNYSARSTTSTLGFRCAY